MANAGEVWGSNPSDVPLQAPALPELQVLTNCWFSASRVEGGLKKDVSRKFIVSLCATDLFSSG